MATETTKFTFEVPPDLRRAMDRHPEVNWTAVFREAIRRHAEAAEVARRIVEEQSDPRVQAVAALLKERVARRHRSPRRDRKGRQRRAR